MRTGGRGFLPEIALSFALLEMHFRRRDFFLPISSAMGLVIRVWLAIVEGFTLPVARRILQKHSKVISHDACHFRQRH